MKSVITILALAISVCLTHASEHTCLIRWVPTGKVEVIASSLFVKIEGRTITEISASASSDNHEDNWTIRFKEGEPLSALFVKSKMPKNATDERESVQEQYWEADGGDFTLDDSSEAKELEGILNLVDRYRSQARLFPKNSPKTAILIFEAALVHHNRDQNRFWEDWSSQAHYNATDRYWSCAKIGWAPGSIRIGDVRDEDGYYRIHDTFVQERFKMSPSLRHKVRTIINKAQQAAP